MLQESTLKSNKICRGKKLFYVLLSKNLKLQLVVVPQELINGISLLYIFNYTEIN